MRSNDKNKIDYLNLSKIIINELIRKSSLGNNNSINSNSNSSRNNLNNVKPFTNTYIKKYLNSNAEIKLSIFLVLIHKLGFSLEDLFYCILAPEIPVKFSGACTEFRVNAHFIAPLLKKMRGNKTLNEVSHILELKSFATYGHWENNRRSVSWPQFLKIVHKTTNRLPQLLEYLNIDSNNKILTQLNYANLNNFNSLFFKHPWTPTVYLFTVAGLLNITNSYDLKINSEAFQNSFFAKLGISELQIQESLKTLLDLRLIYFENKKIKTNNDYFYFNPQKNTELLKSLNTYWLLQTPKLINSNQIDKIDQCATSLENKKIILKKISDLRQEIQTLTLNSKPETVLHLGWQVIDLGDL